MGLFTKKSKFEGILGHLENILFAIEKPFFKTHKIKRSQKELVWTEFKVFLILLAMDKLNGVIDKEEWLSINNNFLNICFSKRLLGKFDQKHLAELIDGRIKFYNSNNLLNDKSFFSKASYRVFDQPLVLEKEIIEAPENFDITVMMSKENTLDKFLEFYLKQVHVLVS